MSAHGIQHVHDDPTAPNIDRLSIICIYLPCYNPFHLIIQVPYITWFHISASRMNN